MAPVYDIGAFFEGFTENCHYRKKAIDSLNLTKNSRVIDVGCGTGLNFKFIENHLDDGGRLVGVDLSPKMLQVAERRAARHNWKNIHLVNVNASGYEPEGSFDAAISTFALEVMPGYQNAINRIFNLLKARGRFAVMGGVLNPKMPYRILNPALRWLGKKGGFDYNRDVLAYIKSRCSKVDYEEYFRGQYFYILTVSK